MKSQFLRSTIVEANDPREFQQSIRTVVTSWKYLDSAEVVIDVHYATRGVGGYSALVIASKA